MTYNLGWGKMATIYQTIFSMETLKKNIHDAYDDIS